MMDSGLIGKIEKAKRYAEERERISFKSLEATLKGENNDHTVKYQDGKWQCTCSYFQSHGICSHIMAFETILDKMVQKAEQE
ncbi:MAG TPA: SWIM zinc finger family protein [Anaerolineaceae bacterium]|nr:SWIM zinc finger family protein [Anaerolineaceae bacterium]